MARVSPLASEVTYDETFESSHPKCALIAYLFVKDFNNILYA